MPRDYSHLEKVKQTRFNWQDHLLKRTMSPRAFANDLTKDFLLVIERMLVIAINRIENIRTYLRP